MPEDSVPQEVVDAQKGQQSTGNKFRGTIQPTQGFDPRRDAETLRKAMKGLGTDEQALIDVIGARTNSELQEIRRAYKEQYQRDLIDNVHKETSGNFRKCLIACLRSDAAYDAMIVHEAIKGLGTDESALIEVICSRTNDELEKIKNKYKINYNKDMISDVSGDTSFNFQNILRTILKCQRAPETDVDAEKAKIDAKNLYKAGTGRWGTNEAQFINILAYRSRAHLELVFKAYPETNSKKETIEDAIKAETSGDFRDALLAVVYCVTNPAGYFATKLYNSMKGIGTDDQALVRLVVTRRERDLEDIKEEFKRKYQTTLSSMIKSDTSGDYRKLLLKIVGLE
eukprot:NODE_801_length_1184_cov_89.406812_g760_i0.p1 GENE.NODE_801_length_1184_cov_89.406812_g760_i0~~NODE_801_length_1184_cov_89.406812_g760_i0.p1  ORF type:complete len:377 (-),score=97.64 NODE_801_length_1184_cov_89.406812_g760_i0:52-1074(-)